MSEPWVNTADASPTSMLVRNVIWSVAEFERGLISERVKMGLARARAQGRKPGRPTKMNGNLEEMRPLIASGGVVDVRRRPTARGSRLDRLEGFA